MLDQEKKNPGLSETALKMLNSRVDDYRNETKQGFCMCGVISAEDWKMIEDLLK